MASSSAVLSQALNSVQAAPRLGLWRSSVSRRKLYCRAVKEEQPEGRFTTSSRTGPSRTTSSRTTEQRQQQASAKPLQARLDEYGKHVDRLLGNLAPKQEGDMMDVVLMSASMAVLIYMSMQLYRVYAFAYYHVAHYQTMMDMMS